VKIMYFIFILGGIFLAGMLYFFVYSLQPRMYPPKKQMQQMAIICGLVGAVFLFIGFVIHIVNGQ
jgi:hypothetical protein